LKVCGVFGILLAIVGLSSVWGLRDVARGPELQETITIENKLYEHKIQSGELQPNEHKRSGPMVDSSGEVARSE
jgi:hypothetical protein